jgi:hypothetical protein
MDVKNFVNVVISKQVLFLQNNFKHNSNGHMNHILGLNFVYVSFWMRQAEVIQVLSKIVHFLKFADVSV